MPACLVVLNIHMQSSSLLFPDRIRECSIHALHESRGRFEWACTPITWGQAGSRNNGP